MAQALKVDLAALADEPTIDIHTPDDRLNDDAMMLYEVQLDQLMLTDSIATYATPAGPLIPVGELTRLLDADITVSTARGTITGLVGQARRQVLVDLGAGTVQADNGITYLSRADWAVSPGEIYASAALIERILPVRVSADQRGLRMQLRALEPFPVQARLERLGRTGALDDGSVPTSAALQIETPYRALTAPAFDVALTSALSTRAPQFARRYDIRAAGDVLFAGFEGYLASDDLGAPAAARAMFERRDPDGMFGPLGVTRASLGDVFTPSLAMGPRSWGGRGLSFTTAPLSLASTFDRIDLRGNLPVGYDVELYVNDVLRAGQPAPVQGRYEFLGVPLIRGTNTIRLVTYGLHGERTEEVRVINVGGGQLPKGQLTFEFGATQQDTDLIDLRNDALAINGQARGRLRVTASLAYGLTRGLTMSGGFSSYSPGGKVQRQMLSAGLRTSLWGMATQLDAAHDSTGGNGAGLNIAGRVLGIGMIARHSEYRGGFIDETVPAGGDGRPLARYSDLTADLSAHAFGLPGVPMAVSMQRSEFASGDVDTRGTLRTSSILGPAVISAGLDYSRLSLRNVATSSRLMGNLAASTFAAARWRLRANADFTLSPVTQLRSLGLSADRAIGNRAALRMGLSHSFEAGHDYAAQASATLRLPFGDLSLDGAYETQRKDWSVGLSFAFGLLFDPLRGNYAMTRSGVASSGSLALKAFVDANGNDLFDTGEEPVAGVRINSGLDLAVTNARGELLVLALGQGVPSRVLVDIDGVELSYVSPAASAIEMLPRPGRTARVMYPLKPEGEVFVRLQVQRGNAAVGVAALKVRAVAEGGAVVAKATEYDGTVSFEQLAPGSYRVELDETQAMRLGMKLSGPLAFVVPSAGGVLPEIVGEIVFESDVQ